MTVALTPGMTIVFGLILVALVLFATEAVPVDVTAIGVLVALLFVDPVTQLLADAGLLAAPVPVLRGAGEELSVALENGLSGFASTATVTVLAMFILSDGIQRTGVVQRLGRRVSSLTGDSESRQLGAIVGIVAPLSGFINNTAAVAVLLPMVIELADRARISPSKLLLSLSYASMFGGTLTLIGTSTNILASDLFGTLAGTGQGFSMFEFTALGVIVTAVGSVYLLTVGRWLTPARIAPESDLAREFGMSEYLTEVVVREDSPIVGQSVEDALAAGEFDVDPVQLIRDERSFLESLGTKTVRAGDVFVLRTDRETLVELLDADGLDVVPEVEVDPDPGSVDTLEGAETSRTLVEVIVAPGSGLVRETLRSTDFRRRYDLTVLAIRRGDSVVRTRMDELRLQVGDALLVQGTAEGIDRLYSNPAFIVAQEIERPDFRTGKTPIAAGIVAGVVLVAALTPVHIAATALAGALAMVATGCLKPGELYEAVQWDVIFLLAGIIPLGIALERTGGAALLADLVVRSGAVLPTVGVLALVYVVTALLTNVISNNASVVLMIPVAFRTAQQLGASEFSFVLAVTFAASTAFMTPVGYQTNLFVYGPGGYRFGDYLRVGGPLQALVAVTTTVGIALIWGV